ncbi:ABC transporter permease subunit [Rossellomorea vietnamensis]|uniref:ABC transporter permease subunit n=1 Tax=Rossellomorea vietnamensis TaxID=218284 RepID=A0A5D4MI72_9BACI|nr:ABC transporter permease subunit [Rossellomorea vietnamensis]TYS01362.1 ABC transporter permease subunit [Rossellomorea vietnamensis]
MRSRTLYKWLAAICAVFVILMVSGSLIFNHLYNGEIPQTTLKYDESGKLLGGAPFKPSMESPLGTDRNGYDMFFKVLEGAQYTLGAAILISILSFTVSFVIGVAGAFRNSRTKYFSQTILTSFYFIPQSIIAYNVLYPLLWEQPGGFETTFTERVLWQIVTLAVVTVPTTAILISNETREILQKEFIMSARVLGGSRYFLFKKHILPHLKLRLFIIFPKIIIQALLIIAHLGFFTLYFGGTEVCYDPFCDPPKPFVQEWAGLMATNFKEIFNAWWIFMGPMVFFSLTILSLNGIAKGLEGLSNLDIKGNGSSDKKDEKDQEHFKSENSEEDFQLVYMQSGLK